MKTGLLIIDMQMMMQHRMDEGRDHVNSDAPTKISALATSFRQSGRPVIHVRHCDNSSGSPLHPDAEGYPAMPCARALTGEPVFIKTTSSAFASTDLEAHLRREGITDVVIVGAVAGFCVQSAVRSGTDLGFNMTVVRDAVIEFDLPAAGLSAQAIFDVTLGLLGADFAKIVDAASVA